MKGLNVLAAFLGGAAIGATLGILFAPEKGEDTRAKIAEILRKKGIRLSRNEMENLVDEIAAEIKNEVSILFGNGLSKRPDRVIFQQDRVIVIDYKFGEQINPSHYQQINTYLKLIRQMGYQQVEGFLWYVELGKIEAIP